MAKGLIEVLIESGIELEDSSRGRKVARCPFHEGDRDPSFTIYPNDTYYCFACEVWGDALKFLVDFKHWDFEKAMEYLGEDYTIKRRDKPQIIKVKDTLNTYRFLAMIALQYHDFLMDTPGALRYLESRGLSMETIKHYKLGYTDGRVLKIHWSYEQQIAQDTGLVNKSGFEILSHRIIVPNFTEAEYCDFMVGRTVTNDKIKYLGLRVPKPLQGFYEVRKSPVIFLVEGQFDWLILRQWGYPAAVIGGSHLTRANLELLREKRVVLVPDYDDGVGMETANKIKEQLGEKAVILDYSECRVGNEKLDVASLAESPGGEKIFNIIVEEQLPWISLISQRMLAKWFPKWQTTTHSHLTSNQQVLIP